MPPKLKPPQGGWEVLGRELEKAHGPGILASHGDELAYFVTRRGDPYVPIYLAYGKLRVRVYWLGSSSWRPKPWNGWTALWTSEGVDGEAPGEPA